MKDHAAELSHDGQPQSGAMSPATCPEPPSALVDLCKAYAVVDGATLPEIAKRLAKLSNTVLRGASARLALFEQAHGGDRIDIELRVQLR
ncbi:MAG: hypothetical protein RQ833_11640 [Sphingomonadaceae bacterium]|nr:hypothetical protein [Sphingomonadaceae bacterium]